MAGRDAGKPGRLPKLTGTMRAEVLAVLLASEDMAGMSSPLDGSTTRLSTIVRALTRRYGWPIERGDFPTNTSDGRAAWASVYCLPQEVIDAALDLGARAWIEEVRTTRARRRQLASKRRPL